jgi:hypothetical protein
LGEATPLMSESGSWVGYIRRAGVRLSTRSPTNILINQVWKS